MIQYLKAIYKKIETEKPVILFFLIVSISVMIVLLISWFQSPYNFNVDSQSYILMAEGHFEGVVKPFSNRILHPFLVGTLSGLVNLSLNISFFIVGVFCLIVMVTIITYILNKYVPSYIIVSLFVIPVFIILFQDYFLPDIFYSTLLVLFFLSLSFNKVLLAVLLTFLLMLTREWTLLLVFAVLLIAVMRRDWKIVYGMVIAMVLGLIILNYLAVNGNSNIHHIGWLEYISGKLVYNFLKNDLGIVLWTNTLVANHPTSFPDLPLVVINLPGWLKIGNIVKVGIYSFDPLYPLKTAGLLLTLFGLIPTLVLADILHFGKKIISSMPIFIQVALIYGLLSYFIGTSVGASVGRLIGFGWPCFFIAFPFFIKYLHKDGPELLRMFLLLNFLICWVSFLFLNNYIHSILIGFVIFCVLILLHIYGYRLIFLSRKTDEEVSQFLNYT